MIMEKKNITLEECFRTAWPTFRGRALYAEVKDSAHDDDLWKEINEATEWLRGTYTPDTIKERSGIKCTREAYKACGKDPSRYRPSNEQLCRRLLQGKDLYSVSTVVDLLNLASIRYGYSIGGFDMDKVAGDDITLGIGREGEDYEGIGRGKLNIAGMPVYRDSIGGIGTPTSDNERTKITDSTHRLMCFINGYDGDEENLQACAEFTALLLEKYASSERAKIEIEAF